MLSSMSHIILCDFESYESERCIYHILIKIVTNQSKNIYPMMEEVIKNKKW